MVDGIHRALAMPGLDGQSTVPLAAPTSSHGPSTNRFNQTFRSILDLPMRRQLEAEKRDDGDVRTGTPPSAPKARPPNRDTASTSRKAHHDAVTGLKNAILVYTLLKRNTGGTASMKCAARPNLGGKFYREMWLEEISRKDLAKQAAWGSPR